MNWKKLVLISLTLSLILTFGIREGTILSENQTFAELASNACELIIPKAQVGSVLTLYQSAQSMIAKYLAESKFAIEIKEGEQIVFERPQGGSRWHREICVVEGRTNIAVHFLFKIKPLIDLGLLIWILVNMFWIGLLLAFGRVARKAVLSNLQETVFTHLEVALGFRVGSKKISNKSKLFDWLVSSSFNQKSLKDHVELLRSQISSQETENLELLKSEIKKEEALKRTNEFLEVVRQIQHDIRVPLQTLAAVIGSSPLDDGDRKILTATFDKINSMVADLSMKEQLLESNERQQRDVIAEVTLEQVMMEKKIALQGYRKISFELIYNEKSLNLIKVDPLQFSRVIGNLIQNAVEAIPNDGKIEISCRSRGDRLFILIVDSGSGMTEQVVSQLFQKGNTFGKSGGSGLGLYHARICLGRWGGDISIKSVIGSGTTVMIELPLSTTKAKITSKLEIMPDKLKVVVDDEVDIFAALEKKLGPRTIFFDEIEQFQNWRRDEMGPPADCQYIIDYNLKSALTGLDLLQSLPEGSQATLLTSDYDRPEVLKASSELGFQVLPKFYLQSL